MAGQDVSILPVVVELTVLSVRGDGQICAKLTLRTGIDNGTVAVGTRQAKPEA